MSDSRQSVDELEAWIAGTVQRALAYALTLVRNRTEAEDIVHDCYVRLLSKSAEYDLPRDGTKLLFKAITNACINWKQRKPPQVSWDAVEKATSRADKTALADKRSEEPEEQAFCRELERAVEGALMELPVTQRAVVELQSLGYSLVEVSEMLDLNHGNVRVLLHRARQTLSKQLSPFLEEKRL